MNTSLKDLSAELVISILHFCDDHRSIVRFSAISRRYTRLVKNSVALQLRIELGANEMDIIDGSTHGYAALLQALRRYQDAWINPKPFRMAHKIISDFLFPPYPQLRANDGILRVDSKEWLCLDTLKPSPVGSPIYQEYVFDKEQDLSVQIRDSRESPYSQIYLQSIASGSPHPLARHSVLKVVFHPTHRYVKKTCQLMRNILVAAFNYIYNPGSLSDIVLWDWPSSNLLYRITQSVLGRFEPAFLDESYLVVFTTTRTYYSDDWRERSPALLIYSISPPPSNPDQAGPDFNLEYVPAHITSLRLEFPELLESCSILKPTVALPKALQSNAVGQPVLSQVTYSSAVTLRLHLMMYQGERKFVVFISGRKLREYLHQGRSGMMKWDEWGEGATRWLEGLSFATFCTPGPRYLEIHRPMGNRIGKLSVFDFHMPSMQRQLSRISLETNAYKRSRLAARIKLIDSDNPSITDNIFKCPIVSRLPYTVMTKGWDAPLCSRWVADGEYIVGIQSYSYISVYKLHN